MFSKQLAALAWCRGENFTYAMRSMINDHVDFPKLDFQTNEILQTIPSKTRFFLCPCPALSVFSVYSFHRLQVVSND